jgi:mRNA-degrading endonuclease toxin of MazEF toxin-antitoxin module
VPSFGDIVLVADLLDPNGVNPKTRPCVVVTRDEDLAVGASIVVSAISTLLPGPLPADSVLMLFHPQGRARTGLKTRSAAFARWLVEVDPGRIVRTLGRAPSRQMIELAEMISRIEAEGIDPDP